MSATQTEAETDGEEVAEWECPFCGYTNEKERGVRSHINAQSDDPHGGKSGWDAILKGYDEEGNLVAGGDDIHEEEMSKKDRILNAWLANPQADNSEIAETAGASEGYASSLKRKLSLGEFTREDIDEVRDDKLITQYRKELGEPETPPEEEFDVLHEEEEEPEEAEEEPEAEEEETEEEAAEEEEAEEVETEEVEEEVEKPDISELERERLTEGLVEDEDEAERILEEWEDVQKAVPASRIVDVRNRLEMLRDEAEYELESADRDEDRRVARTKFFVSNAAIDMLDDAMSGDGQESEQPATVTSD